MPKRVARLTKYAKEIRIESFIIAINGTDIICQWIHSVMAVIARLVVRTMCVINLLVFGRCLIVRFRLAMRSLVGRYAFVFRAMIVGRFVCFSFFVVFEQAIVLPPMDEIFSFRIR